ncbi:site-specific integrase, partial [Vibrio parahaemolyticus]
KANIDINTETLYHIFNEEEILSGKEGKRIMAEREKHSKTIYQSREEIRTKVLNGTLSIVEHPTGYCVNPSCDRICASDKSTETCQHEIITRDKVIERGKKRDRLIIKFNSLNTKQFYMASILKNIEIEIKAIEKLLLEHKISFEPFKGNIIALSMRQL